MGIPLPAWRRACLARPPEERAASKGRGESAAMALRRDYAGRPAAISIAVLPVDAGDRAASVKAGARRGNEQEWSEPPAQAFGAEPAAADLPQLQARSRKDEAVPG